MKWHFPLICAMLPIMSHLELLQKFVKHKVQGFLAYESFRIFHRNGGRSLTVAARTPRRFAARHFFE
jgi:hypothetical protein